MTTKQQRDELRKRLEGAIVVEPKRCGGRPTVGATRMPVWTLLAQLSAGDSLKDFCDNYDMDPKLCEDALQALAGVFESKATILSLLDEADELERVKAEPQFTKDELEDYADLMQPSPVSAEMLPRLKASMEKMVRNPHADAAVAEAIDREMPWVYGFHPIEKPDAPGLYLYSHTGFIKGDLCVRKVDEYKGHLMAFGSGEIELVATMNGKWYGPRIPEPTIPQPEKTP